MEQFFSSGDRVGTVFKSFIEDSLLSHPMPWGFSGNQVIALDGTVICSTEDSCQAEAVLHLAQDISAGQTELEPIDKVREDSRQLVLSLSTVEELLASLSEEVPVLAEC